jgi:hypothetical protein
MSIANVFHTQVLSTSGGGSGSLTTTGLDSSGSTIILVSVASSGGTTTTITDSKSNTWTALATQTGASSTQLQMWYCINPTVGASHTFSYAGNSGCFPAMEVVGWSGVFTITPFDQFKVDPGGTNSSTHTAGQLSPGIDNSLLVSVMAFNNTNFTSIDSSFSTYDPHTHDASTVGIVFGYQIQTTATNRTPTFTVSGSNQQYAITSFVLLPIITGVPALLVHAIKQSTDANVATTAAIDTTGAKAIFVLAAIDSSSSEVITDSASNTWTARTDTANGTQHVRLFYCINPVTSATHTFTCTLTSGKPSICVAAFTGAGAYDVENSSTTNNPGNITPTGFTELALTGLSTVNTLTSPLTVDLGWLLLNSAINTTNGKGIGFAYKIQGSKVATTVNWNANDAGRVTNITAFVQDNSVPESITASDSLSLSDSLMIGRGLQLADSFTLTDFINFGLSLPVIQADALSFSDALVFLRGVGFGFSDSLSLSDVLKVATQVARVLGDNILLSDFLAMFLATFPSYSDSFALSDQAALNLSLELKSTDSLNLSDNLQLLLENLLTLSQSDTLNLSDSLQINLNGDANFDSYIRHYLNDVPR